MRAFLTCDIYTPFGDATVFIKSSFLIWLFKNEKWPPKEYQILGLAMGMGK
jgi:hypothetical protein